MENIKYDLDNLSHQDIRYKIDSLQSQGNLRDAYNLAIAARDKGIDVELALSSVLYDYLEQEYTKHNFNAFIKVLKQMDKLELFYIDSDNYTFWRDTQELIIKEAQELAGNEQINNLFLLYTTSEVLLPLYELYQYGTNGHDSELYFSSESSIPRPGMDSFIYDMLHPLSPILNDMTPFEKLSTLAPLIKAINKREDNDDEDNSVKMQIRITLYKYIIKDEELMLKEGQKDNLWKYWQESSKLLTLAPSKMLHKMIEPYYLAFYDENNIESNATKLASILPYYGFSKWTRKDYMSHVIKDSKSINPSFKEDVEKLDSNAGFVGPSFIDQIMLAYIQSLMYTNNVTTSDIELIQEGIRAPKKHGYFYSKTVVYNFGKLLLQLKQYDELVQLKEVIINIINKQNNNSARFWTLLASCYIDKDRQSRIASLELAMLCPDASQDDAKQLINLLSDSNDSDDAQLIINGLVQKFPKLKNEVSNLTDDKPKDFNELLRKRARSFAGRAVFSDRRKNFYVDQNDVEKPFTRIFYSKNDWKPTEIHDSELASNVRAGKCYSAIFVDGKYYGNLNKCEDSSFMDSFKQNVEGHFMMAQDPVYHYETNHGRLEPSDTYVSPELIDKYKLKHFDQVSGLAISHWKDQKDSFENQLVQIDSVKHVPEEKKIKMAQGFLRFKKSRDGRTNVFFVKKKTSEGGYYVPYSLVHNKFSDKQAVTAKLERSWDKKRAIWTRRVISLKATN